MDTVSPVIPPKATTERRGGISKKNVKLFALLIGLSLGCALGVGLGFGLKSREIVTKNRENFQRAVVLANGEECAAIGSNILRQRGSAADAAIATLFCESVVAPESSGLGGGFILTLFIKDKKAVKSLVAMPIAPFKATSDMLASVGNETESRGLTVCVPGVLQGFEILHKYHGTLPWQKLVEPSIRLSRRGFVVSKSLGCFLCSNKAQIFADPALKSIFVNPETQDVYRRGETMLRETYAKTLDVIAKEGAEALYSGSLTKGFVNDIQGYNGIITISDMHEYRAKWVAPIVDTIAKDFHLYTAPYPSSGVLVAFMLNMFNGYANIENISTITEYQRIVETFKFTFAQKSQLTDPYISPETFDVLDNLEIPVFAEETRSNIDDNHTFNNVTFYGAHNAIPEDNGTAHVSILAPTGDAVSVSSTISISANHMIVSNSTGIILNNDILGFSKPNSSNEEGIPYSKKHQIASGKRSMSSMSPIIVLDDSNNARLVMGGTGGPRLTTSIALVLMKYIWQNNPICTAINYNRIHHQLFPMKIFFERGFPCEVLSALKKIGHKVEPLKGFYASVQAIAQENENITIGTDIRKKSSVSGY